MSQKSTDELLKILNSLDSVSELNHFTETTLQNTTARSFPEYISGFLLKSDMSPSELIQNAQIQRTYGYQILNGMKNPGRDKIIALCLALSLTLPEAQRALTLAKEGILYPKNRRDSVLIFCINKHLSVLDTNDLLYKNGENIL